MNRIACLPNFLSNTMSPIRTLVTGILFFVTGILFAQNPAPGNQQTRPVALTGGTIHTATGSVIAGGVVIFEQGIITRIGPSSTPVDANTTEIIDVSGKHIFPGTIAIGTTVGLREVAAVRATLDYQEVGELNPNARALIAYNTDSEIIPTLRSSGILTVQSTPQGGLLSGSSSVFHTDGWNWEDAVLKADDGIWLAWPPHIRRSFNPGDYTTTLKRNEARQLVIDQLHRFFAEARSYHEMRSPETVNLRLQALKPVFEGRSNLYIKANQARDIVDAVRFAKEYKIPRIVIAGGSESDRITEFLKQNQISVVLDELHRLPSHQDENIHQPYSLPGKLLEAGIKTALSYSSEWWRVRNLNYQAGTAAGFSEHLTPEEALKLVTLYPAEILGIDHLTGSLTEGKQATLVVTSGDILDMKTNKVEMAFIKGAKVNLDDKQKRLYLKYKEKYGH